MNDDANYDGVKVWLDAQSKEARLVVAVRASLRVFPLLDEEFRKPSAKQETIGRRIILPILRALAVSVVAIKYPNRILGLQVAATNATQIVADAADSLSGTALFSAQSATAAIVASSTLENETLVEYALRDSISYAIQASNSVFKAIQQDMELISAGKAPAVVAAIPLWFVASPAFGPPWKRLRETLIELDDSWEVWTRWYDSIMEGSTPPGGEELSVYRVSVADEVDWVQRPGEINTKIAKREKEVAISTLTLTEPIFSLSDSLSILQNEKLKPSTVIKANRIALNFAEGDQTVDPLAKRAHPEIIRSLKRLNQRMPKLLNTHFDLANDVGSLFEKIDRQFDEVVAFDVEIWNLSNSISEHLQEDVVKRRLRNSNTPPLDPEDRRALESVVSRIGPWTRFFPNARRLDEEYRAYHNRPHILAAVQAALTGQNERLVFLEEKTKTLMLVALKAAQGSTPQATKAQGFVTDSTKSVAANGLLFTRRGMMGLAAKIAIAVPIGAAAKIGENVVGDFDLFGELGSWAKKHAANIREMFKDDPPDLQNAIDQLLKDDLNDV